MHASSDKFCHAIQSRPTYLGVPRLVLVLELFLTSFALILTRFASLGAWIVFFVWWFAAHPLTVRLLVRDDHAIAVFLSSLPTRTHIPALRSLEGPPIRANSALPKRIQL